MPRSWNSPYGVAIGTLTVSRAPDSRSVAANGSICKRLPSDPPGNPRLMRLPTSSRPYAGEAAGVDTSGRPGRGRFWTLGIAPGA
jgi:hypothetical protein